MSRWRPDIVALPRLSLEPLPGRCHLHQRDDVPYREQVNTRLLVYIAGQRRPRLSIHFVGHESCQTTRREHNVVGGSVIDCELLHIYSQTFEGQSPNRPGSCFRSSGSNEQPSERTYEMLEVSAFATTSDIHHPSKVMQLPNHHNRVRFQRNEVSSICRPPTHPEFVALQAFEDHVYRCRECMPPIVSGRLCRRGIRLGRTVLYYVYGWHGRVLSTYSSATMSIVVEVSHRFTYSLQLLNNDSTISTQGTGYRKSPSQYDGSLYIERDRFGHVWIRFRGLDQFRTVIHL